MKDIRLIVLACLVLVSLIIIIYPWLSKSEGVLVTSVGDYSACKNVITVGSVIREISDKPTGNVNEFLEVTSGLGGFITLIINNNPRSCSIPENSTIDISVRNTGSGGLRFGVDVSGGVFYLYKPEKDVSSNDLQNILTVVESRIKKYGLINTGVKIENNSIQIFTDSTEEEYINYLVEQAVLEGNFFHKIKMIDGVGEFSFNDKIYEIVSDEELVSINNSEYKINQYLTLDGMTFHVKNISINMTELSMIIFDEGDLILPESNLNIKYSRIMKQDNNYVFIINTQLKEGIGENFEKATKGREITISPSGESFLKEPIIITIDGEPIISLPVSGINTGKKIEELALWSFRGSSQEAAKDMLRLISTIETKRLPTKLILIKTDSFTSPSLNFFTNLSFYVPLSVFFVMGFLFFIRYHKGFVPIVLLFITILSELLIIVGIINLSWLSLLIFLLGVSITLIRGEIHGWLTWLTIFLMLIMSIGVSMTNWIINTSFIVGIITFTIFSSYLIFVMIDSILTEKTSFSQNEYKHSSRKITTYITAVNMLVFTLFFIGGIFKAFSMVVFVGSLVSLTITKPIYYHIIGKTKK